MRSCREDGEGEEGWMLVLLGWDGQWLENLITGCWFAGLIRRFCLVVDFYKSGSGKSLQMEKRAVSRTFDEPEDKFNLRVYAPAD